MKKVKRVTWTPQGLDDLESIGEFINLDNPLAAEAYTEKIMKKAETLKNFPHRGRIVPEFDQMDIREVFQGNYRIIYRINEDELEIMTVLEGHKILGDL